MKAEAVKNTVLAFLGTVTGVIADALGGWDDLIVALVVLMAVDFVSGLVVALVFRKSGKTADGSCSSGACFRGLVKKTAVLVCVGIGSVLDGLFDTNGLCRTAVIAFFIGNEGLSICENLGLMGVPLPTFVQNAFELLRKRGEDADPIEKEENDA